MGLSRRVQRQIKRNKTIRVDVTKGENGLYGGSISCVTVDPTRRTRSRRPIVAVSLTHPQPEFVKQGLEDLVRIIRSS